MRRGPTAAKRPRPAGRTIQEKSKRLLVGIRNEPLPVEEIAGEKGERVYALRLPSSFAPFAREPVGQIPGFVPGRRRATRVFLHPGDKFGIIEPQQDCINTVDDFYHERAHFIIANTRKLIPGNFAIGRHDFYIGKITGP